MRTIKIILSSLLYLGVLNLSGQTIELNKQIKKNESLSESTKTFFVGGNISSSYSDDFGPQGNIGSRISTFGAFDINTPSTTSTFNFFFNPYVGIVKTNKVSIGISALFSLDRDVFGDGMPGSVFSNPEPPSVETGIRFGLGAFYRRDLLTKDRFTLFAQFESLYSHEQRRSILENESPEPTFTNNRISLFAELGGKFAVNQNWNLIASIASVNFNTALSRSQLSGFRLFRNELQFSSFLSNIRFGVERSF